METFGVDDKSYYDIASEEDLKELWETELDPAMQEALRLQSSEMAVEWTYMDTRDIPGVILHDRLMTDAALGTRPIKTEHSYSLTSDGDSLPDSPISHHKVDDMDDECLPAISMKSASCDRLSEDPLDIKDEPFSESESPHSSCPSSPQSHFINGNEIHLDIEMSNPHTTAALLKPSTRAPSIFVTSPHTIIPQRIHMKLENGVTATTAPFHLPPTPPSCSSSDDSEDNGNVSRPPSPIVRKTSNNRLLLSHHHTSTRQPIHTPLISNQPKGSTGTLVLTEEEKRTLIAEGYPVPTRLPLTKAEEKSLKKIRRKIKNKISAQESRRKKKEYMDQLERKVDILVSENSDYKKKIENLEDVNSNLLVQLQKLQAIVSRTHPQLVKTLLNN